MRSFPIQDADAAFLGSAYQAVVGSTPTAASILES
jgi:hypothetical protein